MSVDFTRTVLRVFTAGFAVFLLLLIIIGWAGPYFDTSAVLNQAGLQRSRVERIAGYVLRFESDPGDSVQTVAILQATLPAWEQEEATLGQSNDQQVLFFVQAEKSAYVHIDQAAKNVLSTFIKSDRVDGVQIAIVIQYERGYFLNANDLVFYLQYQAQARTTEVAILQTVLLVLLIGSMGLMYALARKKLCQTTTQGGLP